MRPDHKTRTSRRLNAFLLWGAAAALWSATAGAQQSGGRRPSEQTVDVDTTLTYDTLVERGLAAFSGGRALDARVLFERAHALAPSARTLRVLGITALALDRYTQGRAELEAALADPRRPLTPAQRREVTDLLDWMRTSLGSLRLECTPAHAKAMVDDKPVEKPEMLLEPGEHQLTVSAEGFEPQEQRFSLSFARDLTLRVDLLAKPKLPVAAAPRSSAHHTLTRPAMSGQSADSSRLQLWPWLTGAGFGLLAAGGTLLAFGLNDVATVEDARDVPLSRIEPAHDRAPWLSGGGIALGVGGVGALVAALASALAEPADRAPQAWSIGTGSNELTIQGRFQ